MKALQVPVITWVLLGLLLFSLYDHYPAALAASGGAMGGDSFDSGYDSSGGSSSYSDTSYYSSDSYSSQRSSPAPGKAPLKAPSEVELIVIMIFLVIVFVLFCCMMSRIDDLDTAKTSILKIQVGLLGTGRSLQRDLNRIAESADTYTSKGFNNVLQEAIQALLRHSDYCISGYSSMDVKRSLKECEKRFKQLSVEERGKFDEETLVNVNGIREKSETSQSSNKDHIAVDVKRCLEEYIECVNKISIEERSKFDEETLVNVNNIRKKSATSQSSNKEYIVVTIIVAARGVPQLLPIKSSAQLKKALQMLASFPSSNIMGARVLWTPQKEDDSLTEQRMLEDYPLLRPL